jgi:hypothetical protein
MLAVCGKKLLLSTKHIKNDYTEKFIKIFVKHQSTQKSNTVTF